mmetsp:Transcript_60217/g.168069  ORF Transcript_60217/g.168069 Transcript_60217/m.168069 type:complete len:230 (+) Transcript_60217:87-776(+)
MPPSAVTDQALVCACARSRTISARSSAFSTTVFSRATSARSAAFSASRRAQRISSVSTTPRCGAVAATGCGGACGANGAYGSWPACGNCTCSGTCGPTGATAACATAAGAAAACATAAGAIAAGAIAAGAVAAGAVATGATACCGRGRDGGSGVDSGIFAFSLFADPAPCATWAAPAWLPTAGTSAEPSATSSSSLPVPWLQELPDERLAGGGSFRFTELETGGLVASA